MIAEAEMLPEPAAKDRASYIRYCASLALKGLIGSCSGMCIYLASY